MNVYNLTILGGNLGLLLILLYPVLIKYLSQFLSCELINEQFTHIKNISDAEQFTSSVWCTNRIDGSKLCKFRNLYYVPDFKDCFIFLMNEFSVVSGVENLKLLSLSTVQNHNKVNLKFVIIKTEEYLLTGSRNISFLETETFLMKSFKPDNIMHVIHDDLLPLFTTYKELCDGNISLCVSSYHLILIDVYKHTPYFEWYEHFSVHKPIRLTTEKYPLCIKRGYFGLSNSSIWYQYGFKNTQGPIFNDFMNNLLLIEFAEFIRQQFGLLSKAVSSTNLETIVFFSRKVNRKILNEAEVQAHMLSTVLSTHKTSSSILNLDLSTNSSKSIVAALGKTQLLVGVHGSAMILAMFMHPGSYIIELFPFGIQPEYVSPLRALCKLPHVHYHYESWVNTDESNTRTHPEYPPLLGGLLHLEAAKQNIIMNTKIVPAVECCHDPLYLFRMFQDTIVDDSFYSLFHKVVSNYSGLNLSKQEVMRQNLELMMDKWFFPPPVFNLSCICCDGRLKVFWDFPLDIPEIQFSVATSNGILSVTKQTNFIMDIDECDAKCSYISERTLSVWVKTVDGDKDSLDSFIQCVASDQDIPS